MPSITIGEHLVKRLSEVGVDTVFGIPGDYNMVSEADMHPLQPLDTNSQVASLGYH